LRSLVCWESTVLISSAIGSPCGSLTGCPYISPQPIADAPHAALRRSLPAHRATLSRRVPSVAGAIEESELACDGVRVFYRRVEGDGTADRLLPRQPDPRRGLAALPRARWPGDRDRHAGLGPFGPARSRRFDYSMYGLSAFLEQLPRAARRPRASWSSMTGAAWP
jgi:hypothetical protein